MDGVDAGGVERADDFCVVWTPETAGDEDFDGVAFDSGDPVIVGDSFFRVLPGGAGEQDRVPHKRRAVLAGATQGYPGSDIAVGIHRHHYVYVQGGVISLESSGCFRMPCRGGVLCISE